MKLSWRIILLVLLTTTLSGLGNYFLTQYQERSLHNDSEKILAKTIFQSLRDTLVQDVIDSNKLRVTDVLKKLQSHDNPIEYLYITNGGPRHIFAHSFLNGFPRYLLADSEGHLEHHLAQHDIELTKKIQTDRGLIYVYAEPLLPGLEAVLHIGINQTEIRGQLARNRQTILVTSFSIMLLALLIAFLWSKRITQPLFSFSQQLKLFAEGQATDFNRIKTTTPEIQQLASTFQKATADRQQAIKTLQESEQRFIQLADNIHEVFWLGSSDWSEIFYISPAYELIWGGKPEDLYRNPRLWIEAVYPDDREQVINDIPKDMNTIGECLEFRKYRIQRPDGQTLWIKARAYPIRDHDGQVIRIAGIAEDITEQVDLEETLRRTQKMDALGKLTGGIAHDYNNMLGIILGYTELLKGQISQPKLMKYIDTIHHAGERGEKLTRKLLAFSRKNISDAEILNINALLQDKQHMLEKILTARIKLKFELEDKLWSVWLDDGDLEDAIVNLSINAMHAIDGNGQLTIQTHNVNIDEADARLFHLKAGNYVQLSVNDTGRGMSEDIKEKIFEPFFSTKGKEGTGLGLSQVYGFVQRSGGTIKIYSEPDHGTRVVLYFPRYHEPRSNEKLREDNTELDLRGHENILVIDDELALLGLTSEILESQGYQTICVENAKQALDILECKPIDLVISDVIMPEMDGYQLAAKVRDKYPGIKIQLVSGFADDSHINMINDNLHDNLIYKPYQSRTLLKKIRDLLDGI